MWCTATNPLPEGLTARVARAAKCARMLYSYGSPQEGDHHKHLEVSCHASRDANELLMKKSLFENRYFSHSCSSSSASVLRL